MSKIEIYKQKMAARRTRERNKSQRVIDAAIGVGGSWTGGRLAATFSLPLPEKIMGIAVPQSLAAAGLALGIEMSGLADKGFAGRIATDVLQGFSAGKAALEGVSA